MKNKKEKEVVTNATIRRDAFRQIKLERIDKIRAEFFKTVASGLHKLSEAESIFTKRFILLLKNKLGTAASFLAKNARERRKHSFHIQDLVTVESEWSALITKSKNENALLRRMYPKEISKFLELYTKRFEIPEGLTHKQKKAKYGSAKVKVFCIHLLEFLRSKKAPFLDHFPWDKLNKDLLETIAGEVVDKMDPEFFFKDLLNISMKKAFDNRINLDTDSPAYKTRELRDPFLFVKRTDLMYPTQKIIIIYITLLLFNTIDEKIPNNRPIPEEDLIRYLDLFFKANSEELMSSTGNMKWYRNTFDVSMILIDFFSQCGIVVGVENLGSKEKTNVIFWLQHKLENTVPFSHHLPRIVAPRKIDNDVRALERLVAPYHKGTITISTSEKLRTALNLAQKKCFKVSTPYLKYLEMIHNDSDVSIENTPYPTKRDVRETYGKFHDWDSTISVCPLQKHVNKGAMSHLGIMSVKKEKRYSKSLIVAEVSPVESELNYTKQRCWKEYTIQKAKRQILQTSIVIARVFKDFPIYYGTKLDYRTRMYPWEYLLSRTTGELKQLLCDYIPKIITLEGLKCLMTAYYRFSFAGSVQFDGFLKKKGNTFATCKEFFSGFNYLINNTCFNCEDKVAYVLTLHTTLSNIFCDEKTEKQVDTFVEIDQVCSGIMLLSILLRLKPLAEETNVLGGNSRDIYKYLMQRTEHFIQTNLEELLDDTKECRVTSLLVENRGCNKQILMQWGYEQGAKNREKCILVWFKEHYSSTANPREYKIIQAFAQKYDDFLESIFPRLATQKGYLLEVLKLRIKGGVCIKGMSIRTLDGCSLSWDVDPVNTVNKGYWNPVTNKPWTYKIRVKDSTCAKASSNMVKDYCRGLFPNLIHSIDAALMRLIIYRVWKRTKYTVNQLHDCIMCHPNIVPAVYEVLHELYTDDTLDDLADKVFFSPMKDGLDDDTKQKMDVIRDKFYANGDSFDRNSFIAENAYVYEGSVKKEALEKELRNIN